METEFAKFYEVDENLRKELWEDCIIVFDTSALLELYYYSPSLIKKVFDRVFPFFKDRLWLPKHVEFEYLKNRTKVHEKPIYKYNSLIKEVSGNKDSGYLNKIEQDLNSINGLYKTIVEQTNKKEKHPYLETVNFTPFLENYDLLKESLKVLKEEIVKEIAVREQEIRQNDPIIEGIKTNFEIGRDYSFKELMAIANLGDFRYKYNIPPGFEDWNGNDSKEGIQVFGDLIVWFQIIEFAKEKNKSIILISNDTKKDWWLYDGTKRIESPRLELIKEIHDEANVKFWMYTLDKFLYYTNEIIEEKLDQEDLQEVVEIRQENEIIGNVIYKPNKDNVSAVSDWLHDKYPENEIVENFISENFILNFIIKKTDFEFTGVIIRRNILEGFQLIEESIETDERLTEFIIFYFGKRFVNNKRLVKTSIDKIKRKYNIDVKFVQLLRDHGKIEHELIIN